MHISGVLVHARSEQLSQIRDSLSQMDGVEIHVANDDGKLIVTVEKEDERATADVFEKFYQIPGLLSATLVYHHFEPDTLPNDSAEEK